MANSPSSPEPFTGRFVMHNRREEVEQAEKSVITAIEGAFDNSSCFAIRLALEEALSNAFKHGNKNHPDKKVTMECRVDPGAGLVVIDIQDEGDGFDPDSIPDPTAEENVEIPAGRGLTLIKAFMTEVHITPPGNRVRMTYVRPG